MSRELDAKVAQKIFGWTDRVPDNCNPSYDVTATPPDWSGMRYQRVPDYSTEISAAWQVWTHLCDAEPYGWAVLANGDGEVVIQHVQWPSMVSDWQTESAPFELAVCKAAIWRKSNG